MSRGRAMRDIPAAEFFDWLKFIQEQNLETKPEHHYFAQLNHILYLIWFELTHMWWDEKEQGKRPTPELLIKDFLISFKMGEADPDVKPVQRKEELSEAERAQARKEYFKMSKLAWLTWAGIREDGTILVRQPPKKPPRKPRGGARK